MFEKSPEQIKSIYQATKKDLKSKYCDENITVIYSIAKELLTEKLEDEIKGRLSDLRPCDLMSIVHMCDEDKKHNHVFVPEATIPDKQDIKMNISKKVRKRAKTKRVKK